ncbi:hypothetical protein CJ030_MR1G020565 [Morella rubra]|uniref:Uncharacterized protein n=1 Tax=Morella rubra TaxID=262757 RepID=A0A6A1WRF0_9ROSI|nr:hypothetical protein CJ030_MR1G020565 [Morella rubra]
MSLYEFFKAARALVERWLNVMKTLVRSLTLTLEQMNGQRVSHPKASRSIKQVEAEDEGLESTTVAGEEWLESTTVPVGDIGAGAGEKDQQPESRKRRRISNRSPEEDQQEESAAGTSDEGADAPVEAEDSEKRKCPTAEHLHQREGKSSDEGERSLGYDAQSP